MNALTNNNVDVQYACDCPNLPSKTDFEQWINTALSIETTHQSSEIEVTLRIVDENEGQQLNHTWRQGTTATNVLSFPFEYPPGIGPESLLLGDIVICAPVVAQEANVQGKSLQAHWAHLVVHGLLHLVGYDHMYEIQALEMEQLEIKILEKLCYLNPYQVSEI